MSRPYYGFNNWNAPITLASESDSQCLSCTPSLGDLWSATPNRSQVVCGSMGRMRTPRWKGPGMRFLTSGLDNIDTLGGFVP